MLEELSFNIRLQIKQSKEGIFINQSKYIKDLLKKFEIENLKPMRIPISSTSKVDKDEIGKVMDITKYRYMIRSLLYLTTSRPDVIFSVCLCARFQSNPKK